MLETAILLGLLALASSVFTAVRWTQQRRLNGSLSAEVQTLRAAEAELKARERSLKESHKARRDELQTLKHDVGAQRKKNHTLQEELNSMRDALREQVRLRQEAQNMRPAFADADSAPRPKPKVEVKAEPTPPPAPKIETPAPAPVAAAPDAALEAKVARLQKDLDAAVGTMLTERVGAAHVKEELKKLRRRAEDLRRIDIISKSKVELLEDKLRGMGRQYYDVISELAAARGEVIPPRPRELAPPPPQDDAKAEAEAMFEAEDEEIAPTESELGAPN